MSQIWGGGKYGGMTIPRIGHEVIVDFLEGDPDQPIIIGRTYHEVNMPAYNLPEDKTKMVIRSDTHKNDKGKIGFNELSFEDDKGREEVFIHAERDFYQITKENTIHSIGGSEAKIVKNDLLLNINKNKGDLIGGNYEINIGYKFPVFEDFMNKIKIIQYSNILNIPIVENTSSGNLFVNTKNSTYINSGQSSSEFAAKLKVISSGKQLTLASGERIDITSAKKITLRTGDSMLMLKENGEVSIKCKKIKIYSEEMASIKSGKINLN